MSDSEPTQLAPLAAIRDKERILLQQIRDAEERAKRTVAEANVQAEAIKQQAEREGLRDAETLYQEGVARAKEEADALSRKGEMEALKLNQEGLARVEEATNYIVEFILPRLGTPVESRSR